MNKVEMQFIELRTEKEVWLGDIVITSNCMICAFTDWGSFNFRWCSAGKDLKEFKNFLININSGYLGDKIYSNFSYMVGTSRKADKACQVVAEKILPALQGYLKKEVQK